MDYVGRSNVGITFFSGDVTGTNRCTSISINEDSIVEYNETFNVILTENSDRLVVQSGRNNTQITIIEDDDCKSCPMQLLCYCNLARILKSLNGIICIHSRAYHIIANSPHG